MIQNSYQLSIPFLPKKSKSPQNQIFPSGPETLRPVIFLNSTSSAIPMPEPKKTTVVEKLWSRLDEVTRTVVVDKMNSSQKCEYDRSVSYLQVNPVFFLKKKET